VFHEDAKKEMLELFVEGTPLEKKMRYAEIRDVLERAERGELLWGEDLQELERHPSLLELRWELNPFASEDPPVLLRLYFAEPRDQQDVLLALHFHFKVIEDSDLDTRAAQNDAIDVAEGRRVDSLYR
jgi:hypothetical protein